MVPAFVFKYLDLHYYVVQPYHSGRAVCAVIHSMLEQKYKASDLFHTRLQD